MNVPLFDLTEQNQALEPALQEACERVLKSGRYIQGPEVSAFESAVAEMVGVEHGIAVSSGTDALVVALMALDIGPGDEVICPSFTFFATAGSIQRLGARPVWVDCCPVSFNLLPTAIEAAITPATKAIIPVHLFGQCADMGPIVEIARRHDLLVVEDAAQAIGAAYQGVGAGALGLCGTFSFYPSKNLGGFGEGGLITTNDADFAHKMRIMRNHGMEPRYHHSFVGGNFRLDEIQAALLSVKLPHLPSYAERRQENAAFYQSELSGISGVTTADPTLFGASLEAATPEGARLILPVAGKEQHHTWNQFTMRVIGEGQRDALRQSLSEQGVAAEIYYPVPLDQQACFQDLETGDQPLPVTNQLAEEVLSIPIFPELGEERRHHVARQIAAFFHS